MRIGNFGWLDFKFKGGMIVIDIFVSVRKNDFGAGEPGDQPDPGHPLPRLRQLQGRQNKERQRVSLNYFLRYRYRLF